MLTGLGEDREAAADWAAPFAAAVEAAFASAEVEAEVEVVSVQAEECRCGAAAVEVCGFHRVLETAFVRRLALVAAFVRRPELAAVFAHRLALAAQSALRLARMCFEARPIWVEVPPSRARWAQVG